MPKFRIALVLILAAAGLLIYHYPNQTAAIAQTILPENVQNAINQAKDSYSKNQAESETLEQHTSFLSSLNSQEFEDYKKIYESIKISSEQKSEAILKSETVKSLSIMAARNEKLNIYLYLLIDQLNGISQSFTESGFDSANMSREIPELVSKLQSIEAANIGIKQIMEDVRSNKLSPKDGLASAVEIVNSNRNIYAELFDKISRLRSNNLAEPANDSDQ